LLLIPTWWIVREQAKAKADTVNSTVVMSCAALGINLNVNLSVAVTDQDPVTEGTQETIDVVSSLPALPITVTVNDATMHLPIPNEVASVDAVTFTGGNLSGSYTVSGSDLAIKVTGPVSSDAVQVPKISITGTLKSGIGNTTIQWKGFTSFVSNTSLAAATC